MKIPARFLRVSSAVNGVKSEEGWPEVDIRALDLDGVTKLHINLADVARVKAKRDAAAETFDIWDSVFGKDDDEEYMPPPL